MYKIYTLYRIYLGLGVQDLHFVQDLSRIWCTRFVQDWVYGIYTGLGVQDYSECVQNYIVCWFVFSGLEQMILYHPEHINLKKDDGFNPLLMACVNNHVDLVALLVSHVSLSDASL